MKGLRIADDLVLPLDAVTQTFAFLAKRGMGKTYGAGVLVEEMAEAGAQLIIIDPTDVWWGLKSSADGKSAGYPFIIFGGNHADVPLLEDAGKPLADFVVESGHSLILSTRLLSKGKQRRVVADFFERLYERKGEPGRQDPLHVLIDEADAYVPQQISKDSVDAARCVGAIDDIVRRGRSSGLGVTLVSQRAAKINKDVLSQAEILVAMQTAGKHDRTALKEWIEANADVDQMKEFIAHVVKLQRGEAWVWSPSWLQLLQPIKFRQKRTFDSSRTPKAGERRITPRAIAEVDLKQLEAEMTAAVEKAKAEDPKELKRQLAELKRQLLWKQTKTRVVAVDPSAIADARAQAIRERDAEWQGTVSDLTARLDQANNTLAQIHEFSRPSKAAAINAPPPAIARRAIGSPANAMHALHEMAKPQLAPRVAARQTPNPQPLAPQPAPAGDLRGGTLRMVQVLVDAAPARFTEGQWAALAKMTLSGGAWQANRKRVLALGLVDEQQGFWTATEAAIASYGDPSAAGGLSQAETVERWKSALGQRPAEMIDVLLAHPRGLSREQLGEFVAMTPSGGAFQGHLSLLRQNGLIDADGEFLRASAALTGA